jgi:hypothetical protein
VTWEQQRVIIMLLGIQAAAARYFGKAAGMGHLTRVWLESSAARQAHGWLEALPPVQSIGGSVQWWRPW